MGVVRAVPQAATLLRAASKITSLRPSALPEIAAFCARVKPSLRLVLHPEDAVVVAHAVEEADFRYATRMAHVEHKGGTWSSLVAGTGDETVSVLTVAESQSVAAEVLDAEFADLRHAGRLLGYPECCVLAFPELSEAGGDWPFAMLSDLPPDSPLDARLNRFAAEWGGIGLLGEMYPCSLKCAAATDYANRIHAATVSLGLQKLADTAVADALCPIVISDDGSIRPAEDTDANPVRFRW